jgi:tetratricopeptide (TPR) repeat protein
MASSPQSYADAVASYKQGRLEHAQSICRQLLDVDPKHADANNLLGLIQRRNGDHASALDSFRAAAVAQPNMAAIHLNVGLTLTQLGRAAEAEHAFRQAYTLEPNSGPANFHLGLACHYQSRFVEAVNHFRTVLRTDPNHANTLAILGMDLMLLGRLDEARASLEKALQLRPDVATIHDSLGILAETDGRREEALHSFQRALVADPSFAPAHFNRAIALLRQGRLTEGLPEYEWRWRLPKDARAAAMRHFPQQLWTGEPLADESILVWLEQGLGDEIRSSSLLPSLAECAGRVIVECDPRLMDLLTRSMPAITFVARQDPPQTELNDASISFQCPGDTLLRHVVTSLDSFAGHQNFLKANVQRTEAYSAVLRRPGDDKRLIGISWQSRNAQFAAGKAVALETLSPILSSSGLTFVDLQYGDTRAERAAYAQRHGDHLIHFDDLDTTNDIDGLAALISACDLVITVSNTTAHLAGALGVPTWVMLPFGHFQPWYWFSERIDSPWYPSVKLYRPTKFNDWANLIARVAKDLAKFVPPKHDAITSP